MAFNIDFNLYKPSSKGGTSYAPGNISTPTPAPQQRLQLTPPPKPTVTQKATSIGMKAFDLLGKPAEFTENKLTGGKGYEEILKSQFQRESTRKAVAFTGRLLLDPLNLAGGIGKLKYLNKIPGVAKTVSKGEDVLRVAKATAAKATELPGASKVKDALGKNFVKGYGLPNEYNILKDQIPTTQAIGQKKIIEDTQGMFGKQIPLTQRIKTGQQIGDTDKFSKDVIEMIPKFLEPKGAGKGANLGVLKQEIEKVMGKGAFEVKVRPVLRQVKEQFDNDIHDLVGRGRMDGETAKRLLTQGGYYPHTDFAPDRLKQYFKTYQTSERRGYLKARKGAEGFTFNAPKAIAKRELQQFNDNVTQDFLKDVKKQFGVQVSNGNPAPEGFIPFVDNTRGRLRELQGWALPQRIADDLNTSFAPAGAFFKALDTFNSAWKPTATSLNPAFHIQNVIGNHYNSWLGGMKDPRRFLQATAGRFDEGEKAILEKSGVLARGQFGGDVIRREFGESAIADQIMSLTEPFRRVGEFFENNSRSAFFLDQRAKLLKKGLSEVEADRQALKKVNEYLFDYLSGLTPFETNVMRRIFPFYTWARFNIPLQLKSIITQPQKVAAVAKLNTTLNGGFLEGDQPGFTIPTPFTDSEGNQVRWRPNLPVQDIFNLNPVSRAVGMSNPLIKDAANTLNYAGGGQETLYDTFSGSQITNKNLPIDVQAKDILKNRATGLIRPLRSVQKATVEEASPTNILREIIGGTYVYDEKRVQQQAAYDEIKKKDAIQNYMQKILRDPNLSVEEKNRKLEQFRQATP